MAPTISLPPSSTLSPPQLKQSQKVSAFYFVYVYKPRQPYSLTFISSIHPPLVFIIISLK
jgi:hypothetical protein